MKDLLERITAQRKDVQVSRRSVTVDLSKKALDDTALSQWLYFKRANNYKRTVVLHKPWLEAEVFVDWYLQNRDFERTFCFHLDLSFPIQVNPNTCGWVAHEVAVFMDWLYANMRRRVTDSDYPIGVTFTKTKLKLESRWRYNKKNYGDYFSRSTLAEAQAPFKQWLLKKIDEIWELSGKDSRLEVLLVLRERLVKAIELNELFEL